MKVFLFNPKRVLALLVLITAIAATACTPGLTPVAAVTEIVISTETAQTPIALTPTDKPTLESTATATASFPKVSNGTYEIQATEVLTSPRIGSDLVDLYVRFVSNDPKLTEGSGNPIACGAVQDASGESWTASGFGSVRKDGKLLHTFCEFLISGAATGLIWTAEGYPSVDLGL